MSDSIEKQCKTCSHWQGTICKYRPWPTGEACADWEGDKPMSDLINRQTAINTLLKAYPLMQKEKLVEVMETVPGTETGDCISRQKAIDALGEEPEVWSNDNEYELGMRNQWLYDRKTLESLPSAQPQRKTGKWILTDFPDEQTYECSACNEIWTFITGTPIDNGAYFCPNCGADMRGKSE